jgi:hypothetical protein
VGALAASLSVATIATAAALLAGASYRVWRNWSAIVRTLREFGAAVSREAIGIMHKLMTAVEGEPADSAPGELGPADDAATRRRKRDRRYGLAASVFDSVAASVSRIPRGLVALNQPRLWGGFQRGPLIVRKAAAIAMLSAPLLAAPAMATISSGQPRLDTAGSATIVINSTPTIVINACQPTDIEQQIMEALRRHREALYEQLCSELQRRQRIEF